MQHYVYIHIVVILHYHLTRWRGEVIVPEQLLNRVPHWLDFSPILQLSEVDSHTLQWNQSLG